jgi:hypothetical protein
MSIKVERQNRTGVLRMDKWLDAISENHSDDSKEMLLTIVKEDARKSRSMAHWSFSGVVIPLLGLIFGIYSLYLSREVPDKGKIGKFKHTSKRIAISGLAVSLIMAVIWSGILLSLNKQHETKVAADQYKSEVANLDNADAQYQTVYQSWINLPSRAVAIGPLRWG